MTQDSLKQTGKQIQLGVVLPLLGLIALGLGVALNRTLLIWDTAFLLRLHHYAVPRWHGDVAIATHLGTTWGVLPASVLLIMSGLGYRRWLAAFYLAVAMAGSVILSAFAKLLWHRVRPVLWEGIPPHADFSFPSGHATHSMTFVVVLLLLNWQYPQRGWLLLSGSLFVVSIGLTRVYLGVHYPSDILGGWLLAVVWAMGLYQIILHFQRPFLQLLQIVQSSNFNTKKRD